MTTSTLSFGSRTYSVEKVEKNDFFRDGYMLTGPRGAQYALVRRNKQPEIMFAVQLGGRMPKTAAIFKSYLFTDKDGALRSFRRW